MIKGSARGAGVEMTSDQRPTRRGGIGKRRRQMLLVLSLLVDAAAVVLFLLDRAQPAARGWLVLLVLPVVLGAAQNGRSFLRAQTVAAMAALAGLTAFGSGPLGQRVLSAATIGGSLLAAGWITDRLLTQIRDRRWELERASRTDPLTGLLNRRGLEASYPDLVRDAALAGQTVGVVTVDVDGMKTVNDTLGHAAGDEVLVRLTNRLERAAPAGLAARTGGDEMVLVVPGEPDAAVLALHESFEGEPLPGDTTVSIGSASGNADSSVEELWALLDRADRQMYLAKRGREGTVSPSAEGTISERQSGAPARFDGRTGVGRATGGIVSARVEPTREQRLVYAAVIGWDAVVGAAASILQRHDSSAHEPNSAVLAVGLTTAAALIWAVLRPAAGRRTLTAVLLLGVLVLCLIAVTTSDGETTHVGIVLWGPILLVAARYWPHVALRSLYLLLVGLHLLNLVRSAAAPPVGELVMIGAQLCALVAAAEVLRRLRTGEERMSTRLADLSLCDPLTGLANRRGLEAAVLRLPEGETTALVIDVDRFKQVNDEHGHTAGDSALVGLADALSRCSPGGTVAARLGGDEFALIGPNLDQAAIVTALVAAAASLKPQLSLSIGTASGPIYGAPQQVWDLVAAADQALLDARREDRLPRSRLQSDQPLL